ncbi:DUF2178 domain-containing protein [Halorubrum gandharaense]
MTETSTPATNRLSTRKRYKRLSTASLLVGMAGLFVGVFLDQVVAGVLVYWAGFVGMIVVWRVSPVELYDERDTAIERRTSEITLNAFGVLFVAAAPGGVALEAAGVVELPPEFGGAMWTLFAIYVTFGVVYTYLSRQ